LRSSDCQSFSLLQVFSLFAVTSVTAKGLVTKIRKWSQFLYLEGVTLKIKSVTDKCYRHDLFIWFLGVRLLHLLQMLQKKNGVTLLFHTKFAYFVAKNGICNTCNTVTLDFD